jgi:hypothetical protein
MVNTGGQNEHISSFRFDANPVSILGVPYIEKTGASQNESDFFVSMQMFSKE